MEENIKTSIRKFGGSKAFKTTKNHLQIYGDLDPWAALGLKNGDAEKDITVLKVEGLGHSEDLAPIKETDSEQLKKAREEVVKAIQRWIQ